MTPSVAGSLDPLSSPSPSPSPMPDPMDESELSELTEADEDGTPPDIRMSSTTRPVSAEGPPPRLRKNAAGAKRKSRSRNARKSANAASASSKRKKRGGMVPAPMWGWAYKNGTATIPPALGSGSHPGPPTTTTVGTPATGPHTTHLNTTTHGATTRHPKSASATPDPEEEEEEEEHPTPPRAMEEEEGEEGDPDSRGRGHREDEEDLADEEDDAMDDQDLDEEDEGPNTSSRTRQRLSPVSHRSTSNTSRVRRPRTTKVVPNQGKVTDVGPDGVEGDEMDVDDIDADDHAEGSATEEDYPDHHRYSNITRPLHARSNRPAALAGVNHWDPDASRDDDASHEVQVDAQGAVLSVPPSRAESPREHTPEEDDEPNGDAVGDAAEEPDDGEAVDDEEPSPTEPDDQLGDTPGEVEGDERPNIQDDRESNLDDPELEVEEPDEDPDLQPAHRAEALDVLATIEIKFAMLRERVYIEKMEGLAWEERLVWDETHPELHCIQEELTKRRDKRLLLAERKRRYEVQALEKKRKEEETSIWDNWEYAREQLQTELMAETNRKRRKLERERRAAERPIPVRRFPVPIRDPPPAPSLREIVNAMPLPSRLAQLITSANKKSQPDGVINPTPNSRLRFGLNGLDLNVTAHPDIPTPSPADIAGDLEYIFQHRRVGLGYPYGIFPAAPGVGFPAVGPGISPGMGFGAGVGGAATGFNNVPGVPFGMNGLAPAENYPTGVGPSVTQPGTIPPPATGTSVPPPHNHPGMTGPGVGPADSAGFGHPPMGTFQPNVGREIAYSAGPGGPSTSERILRPFGPPVDREWEVQTQRERELVAREHDRELAQQRDREMRERERLGEMNLRGRDREFGLNSGPGYQTGWNSKASGGADWGLSERRRDDDIMDREREMERVDRGDRDESQVQPGSTPTPRPQNHHSHSLPHHTHSAQSPHLTHPSHSSHSNHQAHSQPPHTLPHHQHQHPHFHSHSPHPNLHTQHQHGPTGTAPHHHHVGQPHHRRHHYHILHNHQSSGSESRVGPASGISVEGPGIKSGQGHQTPTMETINLSVNPSSKTHWKREESKYGAGSVPGSRPSSTHPPFSTYDERDRPVATPFVLGPSQNTVSTASSPRHSWTHGEVGNSIPPGGPGAPFPPPERYHSPVPGGLGTLGMPLRASNPPPPTLHRRQSPNSLTASPSRSGPPTSPTNASLSNPVAPSFCMNTSSPGSFTSQRKSSPVLLPTSKLGMSPILFSPRLTGPGVLPPTGPGVPGMLSSAPTGPSVGAVLSGPPSGPGVPPPLAIPSSTSGPGIPLPNGPGIIPQSGPGVPPAGAGDGAGVPPFTGSRRASPLISFARSGALPGQKIGVESA